MNIHNKSREQLANELEESLKRISSLEEENFKLRNDKKRLFPSFETFISDTALDFLELPLEFDIYQFIGEKIEKLIGEGFVIISTYNPYLNNFKVKNVAGNPLKIKILQDNFPEKDLTDFTIQCSPLTKKGNGPLSKNHPYRVNGGIFEILGGNVPENQCQELEKLLNIGEIYVIGFKWDEQIYGSASIFLDVSDVLDSTALQTTVNLSSVALKNRTAEEALRDSEEKFRNLFNNANDAIFLHKLTEDGISGWVTPMKNSWKCHPRILRILNHSLDPTI
ncbi:MAG: hypothetical protein HY802_06275 [Methanobacterium sp.]|nr:hypothetical protein [Methanobacterium sp.]